VFSFFIIAYINENKINVKGLLVVDQKSKCTYRNYLVECPICGSKLSEIDTECPACEINLVDYNAKRNIANNLSKRSDNLQGLTARNNAIDFNIRRKDCKMHDSISRRKAFKLMAKSICFIIIATFLILVISTLAFNVYTKTNSTDVVMITPLNYNV
jgi:hypothetical protein